MTFRFGISTIVTFLTLTSVAVRAHAQANETFPLWQFPGQVLSLVWLGGTWAIQTLSTAAGSWGQRIEESPVSAASAEEFNRCIDRAAYDCYDSGQFSSQPEADHCFDSRVALCYENIHRANGIPLPN